MKKLNLVELLKYKNIPNKHDFLGEYLKSKASESRIPYSVSLELTPVCNLNCEICYIRRTNQEVIASGNHVLRFDEWKYYIDGLNELGVYCFTLTGGECMLHPDFIQIYEYIYDLGKRIAIISNGTCLTDDILGAFIKRPPDRIFITMYGSSEDTYRLFCGNATAFYSVTSNIDLLLASKLPVFLQFTLGKDNVNDYEAIADYAHEKNIPFFSSDTLNRYDKCDDEKIDNVQADTFEFRKKYNKKKNLETDRFSEKNIKSYNFPNTNTAGEEKGLDCIAAKSSCSINWKGLFRACVSFDAFLLDPHKVGSIKECWNRLVKWGNELPKITECTNCICFYECKHCVAMHYNDTHEFGKVSPRLCFKIQHPEEAAKLQAEYDRRQALKKAEETAE